jgi:hypothetical protein
MASMAKNYQQQNNGGVTRKSKSASNINEITAAKSARKSSKMAYEETAA